MSSSVSQSSLSPSILLTEGIAWDSYDAHQRYMKMPEYQSYIDYLVPVVGGAAMPLHVYFIMDPIPAFNSFITEVIWVTPKAEAEQKAVLATLDNIVGFAGKSAAQGVVNASYGPVVENPGQFVAVIGWSSLKVSTQLACCRFKFDDVVLIGVMGM